jgi:hypothetical protein
MSDAGDFPGSHEGIHEEHGEDEDQRARQAGIP